MQDINTFAWVSKYRPREVDDLIATDEIRAEVQTILDQAMIPNMLLVGPPGIGKTTIARLLVDKLDADSTIVNASLKGNIDTLRNEIQQFAGTVSLTGNHKYVILDEADYLNPTSTQPALRNFIDTYTKNCGFILTANYGNRIIEPLRKRLETHEFKIKKSDIPRLVMQMTKRCEEILQKEGVEYDKASLARFIGSLAPDWRQVLIGLQRYARREGSINSGILATDSKNAAIGGLVDVVVGRDYPAARKWIGEHADNAAQEFFSELIEALEPRTNAKTLPDLFVIVARYQYQSAFVADQQINFAACLAEIMAECVFE